ncbi:MAG: flavodoxin [Prolixibacteraceae bacterium]|jgi:flavodoxin I|nr:flavodoxin [Prolixibacteraceae bacterium]
MKKIAVVYSFNSTKSAKIASKITACFKNYKIEELNVESCKGEDFLLYDTYILSVPTWFDGELPNYWDEMLPALSKLSLKGKKIAVFGLGDQKNYPENFCDAVGILADFFENLGATIIGFTSPDGYSFEASKALKNNVLKGLLLDQENQSKLSDERILKWTRQLENEIN